MYGGGGFNNAWSHWGGGGAGPGVGGGMNANVQGGQQQQQQVGLNQQLRPGVVPQNQGNQFQQSQQQQLAANMMGYAGYGGQGQSATTMGGGYSGAVMESANNPNMNQAQATMMAMAGNNAWANANSNLMNMNPYMNNAFAQQQNAYLQQQQVQQQQQNPNQALFQTNVGYPRPSPTQPPLPPGPPPKYLKPRDSTQPLFNNSAGFFGGAVPAQPPLPSLPSVSSSPAPPPPPPSDSDSSSKSKPYEPYQAAKTQSTDSTSQQHNSIPQIPEAVLRLLQNAETARQLQQAAETLSMVNPLMSLNVSQELFGSASNKGKGIPGLDCTDDDKGKKLQLETVTLDGPPNENATKKSSDWNHDPEFDAEKKADENKNDGGIKWELRDEIKEQTTNSSTSETVTKINSTDPALAVKKLEENTFKSTRDSFQIGSDSALPKPNASAAKPDPVTSESFSATIPLGPKDGPVEYDRRTLRAFDKKFRDWEKQFENWKISNQNHPDQGAYNKYMDQWNLWREQLIEQRRFIIDSMNTARLEANEITNSMNVDELLKSHSRTQGEDWSKDTRVSASSTTAATAATSGPPAPIKSIAPPPPAISDKSPANRRNESHPDSFRGFTSTQSTRENTNFKSTDINHTPNKPQISQTNNFGGQQSQPIRPGPVPLMSLNPSPSPEDNKSGSLPSGPRNDRDRPVERILRDRDRDGLSAALLTQRDSGKGKQKNPPSLSMSDRVARDPHDKADKPPFSLNEVTWEMPGKNNANPFEISQNQQNSKSSVSRNVNPFDIISDQSQSNPFSVATSWGTKSNNDVQPQGKLPTLSDFLNNDECKVTDDYLNRHGFGSRPPAMKSSQGSHTSGMPTSRLEFKATSKLLPLVVGSSKPQELSPPIAQAETKQSESEWFTRDRGGGFDEQDFTNNDSYHEDNLSENNYAAAVIDYGHGSKDAEDDEYDLPRCERVGNEGDYSSNYDDGNIPSNAVTIDYGHGSVSQEVPLGLRAAAAPPHHRNDFDDYNEGDRHDSYRRAPSLNVRGRGGVPSFRGRGGGPGTDFDRHYPSEMQYPPQESGGFEDHVSFCNRDRGDYPTQSPVSRGVMSNRGRGRGRGFGSTPRSENYPYPPGHPNNDFRAQSHSLIVTDTDPEVIMLDESPPRRAPPRDIPIDIDDRRQNSRQDDSRNLRRSKSRDRDPDTYRSDRQKENDRVRREQIYSDERRRADRDRYSRNDNRSSRQESSPGLPKRDRDRRESSRERDTKVRRSRSPDKGPVYRIVLGSAHPGTTRGRFPASNPPPPRYQTVLIEDILNLPGRAKRPSQIIVILRGLPGSGKSYIAKLIKDKEVEMGESAPRILSLDDYFMQETEKIVKDPVTRAEVTKTVMEYEYEPDLEPKYRNDLIKTLKKNVENGYFPFIIVDCVNDQVRHFEDMVSFATQRKFQVYIAEVEESVENCVKRNVHQRSRDEILKIQKNWQSLPANFVKLDVRTLLQDDAVQDVEMEDVSDTENIEDVEKSKVEEIETDPVKDKWEDDDGENNGQANIPETSKWEKIEPSEEKLNRLDGLARKRSGKDDDKVDASLSSSIDAWLQSHLPEDYTSRQETRPGQKRVRWADIEERRAQERMRDVGFVVGHTDWNRMTDPTFGQSALTRTKYI